MTSGGLYLSPPRTIGVQSAHRICAEIAGQLALWMARPKEPPTMDYARMADELQQVVDTLRERAEASR